MEINKDSIVKNGLFQAYIKLAAKKEDNYKYIPEVLNKVGSHILFDSLLSSKQVELGFILDEDFPNGYHVGLLSSEIQEQLWFYMDQQFGVVKNADYDKYKPTNDCLLAFVDRKLTTFHVFISNGSYCRHEELLQKFKNNELSQDIALLLGDSAQDVLIQIQDAIDTWVSEQSTS